MKRYQLLILIIGGLALAYTLHRKRQQGKKETATAPNYTPGTDSQGLPVMLTSPQIADSFLGGGRGTGQDSYQETPAPAQFGRGGAAFTTR